VRWRIFFKTVLFIAGLAWLTTCPVKAATYYISPTGSDANNGTSEALAVFTSTKAAAVMAAGDTLQVIPGDYPSTQRFQLSDFDKGSAWTTGNYTIIQCTVPYGATIRNTSGVDLTGNNNWYFYVKNLVFDGIYEKTVQGHQWKFIQCAFKGGPTSDNSTLMIVGTNNFGPPGASYGLFQDSWFIAYSTGSGRYLLNIYNSTSVVVRRGVFHHEDGWTYDGSNPSAPLTIYNSYRTSIQNCVDPANVTVTVIVLSETSLVCK